jgi:hypothetical protein
MIFNYFRLVMLNGLFIIFCITLSSAQKPDPYENYLWMNEIRDDHPRLFFNKDSFEKIKGRALNDERDVYESIKNRVDALIDQKIEFSAPFIRDGTHSSDHQLGTRAAEAAFVFLVTEDERYLDLSKNLLVKVIEYYQLRFNAKLNVTWATDSRISALAAYDMLYNHLSGEVRREIGSSLFSAIYNMVPSDKRSLFFRESTGSPVTGFYGTRSLPWYAGLVFYRAGIDDDLAEELLIRGFDDYNLVLQHRSNIAGDAGGAASASLNYSMGQYPWAEWNFFHTFNSATGLDIPKQWPYVPYFLHYILWNWLPGNKQYGYGDTDHITNNLPLGSMHIHLSHMIHFFGDTHPELISLAKWMLPNTEKRNQELIPFARFLLTNTYDDLKPEGPPENIRLARHFDNMGQIFLRSGSGDDDTYALFTAGGILTQHRHYDNNNFVIYRKGFLALDSGTRPEPGLHLPFYYARTVAHNCVTIKMPGEKMPRYWGLPSLNEQPEPPHPNDGGQNNMMGSEIVAFDENGHYVYIASDATESYHEDKAGLVLRQFVFLPPDHFVIYDRVTSTKAEYEKGWLLHTAAEPSLNGMEFYSDHWQGRLFCRTILPEEAEITKIGGPGKQFWSDGRNWPLPELTPDDWGYERRHRLPPDTLDLLGQWRIEVRPPKPRADDIFLHLLHVGDTSLKSMSDSSPLKEDDMVGVSFSHGNREYQVMFATGNQAGGKIFIMENGRIILDEAFTNQVKQQKGLF